MDLSNSPARFNPSLPSELNDVEDIIDKMKGDAIGSTLYSERFVLTTLIQLTQFKESLSDIEEFEKDLCTLWDMTIEKDVVRLLLKHSVLELFTNILQSSNDNRLNEILIGIIGNMCYLPETRNILCSNADITMVLLEFISSSDTLTLVQLMRFLQSALIFENSGDERQWFDHFRNTENFIDKFGFILNNSMSTSLLTASLEALNAMCAKFAVIEIQPGVDSDSSFRDIFLTPLVINGVIEAFKQLIPFETHDTDVIDDTSTPTETIQKIMNLFLDINVILTQYEKKSIDIYNDLSVDFFKCISIILHPLCHPIYLFPLTTTQQGVIENIFDIFQALLDPYDGKCFSQMITIWGLIDNKAEMEAIINGQRSEWDLDDENDCSNIDSNDICMTILEFLSKTSTNVTNQECFNNSLEKFDSEVIIRLYKTLTRDEDTTETEIISFSEKIKSALQTIWNINSTEA